jgi:hypothetical protein
VIYHVLSALVWLSATLPASEEVKLHSPGLTPSKVAATGELVEDWGSLQLRLEGETLQPVTEPAVSPIELDGIIPAARIAWRAGAVAVNAEVFRAPAFPAGLDLLTVRLEETKGAAARGTLHVDLPEGARIGQRSVSHGSRRVMILPDHARAEQEFRAWGHFDEASSLPGWASPLPGFDPAFANIRAGMGGVPIVYRFSVEARAELTVVLGFCESYWSNPGGRMMSCKVEGAPALVVDPIARWTRHQPGGIAFEGVDANGDGALEVLVLPAPGTPDRNPILNAIWLFESALEVGARQVITGRLNAAAIRYVDVGGEIDQSILPGGAVEFPFELKKGGTLELTFFVACRGTQLPSPEENAWTPEQLRQAAREVWEDWPDRP